MLKPEALESYVTVSDWRPAPSEDAQRSRCTRCGERQATVSICERCLQEVLARMAVRTPKNKQQRRVLHGFERFAVAVLALGVLALGVLDAVLP